jgi:hypothetical protein
MIRRRRQDELRRRRWARTARDSLQYGDTAHATHLDFLDSNRLDTSTLLHYHLLAIILAWWLPCACRTTARLPDPRAQPSVRSRLRADDSILRSPPNQNSLECLLFTRAEPLLSQEIKVPRPERTDWGARKPFCLDRLRALRSERGSGIDLWTLWTCLLACFETNIINKR